MERGDSLDPSRVAQDPDYGPWETWSFLGPPLHHHPLSFHFTPLIPSAIQPPPTRPLRLHKLLHIFFLYCFYPDECTNVRGVYLTKSLEMSWRDGLNGMF